MNPFSFVPGTTAWRARRDLQLCRQTAARIQEIVDGEVESAKAAKILERHLDACGHCHDEADAIRSLKEAIARVGCDADPELVDRLRALARKLCQESDKR